MKVKEPLSSRWRFFSLHKVFCFSPNSCHISSSETESSVSGRKKVPNLLYENSDAKILKTADPRGFVFFYF